jgi:hypothetical protein
MTREAYIALRIEMIEKELEELKPFVAGGHGNVSKLRGIGLGAEITDEEIDAAKQSLFKGIDLVDSN